MLHYLDLSVISLAVLSFISYTLLIHSSRMILIFDTGILSVKFSLIQFSSVIMFRTIDNHDFGRMTAASSFFKLSIPLLSADPLCSFKHHSNALNPEMYWKIMSQLWSVFMMQLSPQGCGSALTRRALQ